MNQKGAEENLKVRLEEEKNLLQNEHDSDRQAYQKLLQEYHSLELQCETLEKQMNSQHRLNTHMRNISDVSSISTIDENLVSTTDIPEDHGYGSVRSTASSGLAYRGKLGNIDWNEGLVRTIEEKVHSFIVPAILEHGIGGNKMGGFRGRTSSLRDVESPGTKQKPTDALLQELTSHYNKTNQCEKTVESLRFYVDVHFRYSHFTELIQK